MIAAIVPTEPYPASLSEVELAETAAEAARAAWTTWGERRQGQEARARKITAELADVAAQLTASRRASLAGPSDPQTTAELMVRKRDLELEAEEAASLIDVAKGEEAAARAAYEPLAAELDAARLRAIGAELTAKAAQLDQEIDLAWAELARCLEARWQLVQNGGRAGLPRLPFEWRRLSHIQDPHGGFGLPFGG